MYPMISAKGLLYTGIDIVITLFIRCLLDPNAIANM